MFTKIKYNIKNLLAKVGLIHPALGVKIGQEEKALIILGHKAAHVNTFVETGTSEGWMIDRVASAFSRVYSVERDDFLYHKAVAHFQGDNHIRLLHGDSAIEIKKILQEISSPALFWLDAHGEGAITVENSPVVAELRALFSHHIKRHVILIDDARHFDRILIREMRKMAKANNYTFAIESGIFRLYGR